MVFKTFLYYPISGLLIGIGLIYPHVWPLGLLGVGLAIWLLSQEQTWKQRYFGMFFAWTLKSLCATAFFWSIYPIEALPIDIGKYGLLAIGLCWFGVGLSLGTGGFLLVGLLQFSKKTLKLSRNYLTVLLPFAWLVSEVVGSYVFSVFSIGPGGTVNSYFSFGYVGYLLAEHSVLLQIARVAGVYSLIVAVVALMIGLVFLYTKKQRLALFAAVILVAGSSFVPVLERIKSAEPKTVALITTSYQVKKMFDRGGFEELQETQQDAFQAALEESTDYVIWPEDARFFDQENDIQQSKSLFSFLYPDEDTVIIDSSRVSYAESAVLQGLIYDAESQEHVTMHKRYLVPQGEFIPSLYELVLRKLGLSPMVDDLTRQVSYQIGPQISQAHLADQHPGLLFCFESISPVGVKSILEERNHVPFIAHPISHGWFHEPKEVWHQLDASLKVQAVWNNITIASAANHAESKVYFPNGEVLVPKPTTSGDYWEVSIVSVPVK